MKNRIMIHNFVGILTGISALALIIYDFIVVIKVYCVTMSRLTAVKAVNPLSVLLVLVLMGISLYFMNLVDKETTRYHKMLKKKKLQQKRVAS